MDFSWLIPVTPIILGAGGAVGFFIRRVDDRKAKREAAVIETLKGRIEELMVQVRKLERKLSAMRRAAGRWREQLIAHDITPDPAEWPEDPDEQ